MSVCVKSQWWLQDGGCRGYVVNTAIAWELFFYDIIYVAYTHYNTVTIILL